MPPSYPAHSTLLGGMGAAGAEPHRVLRRSIEAANAVEGDTVGEAMFIGERRPMPKFAIPPPVADSSGTIEAFAMYAGTSVAGIDRVEPTADVIARLAQGAEHLLRERCG